MTRNDTKFWVRVLPALLRNYNSSLHSTTRCTPDELHRADLNEQTRAEVHARLQRSADQSVKRSSKKGRRSLRVAAELEDGVRVGSEWYSLTDDEDQPVNKRYYAHQLQKVDCNALVRSTQQQLPRLSASSASPPPQFNREAHVASLPDRRRTREPLELPAVSALEERRQGSVARERQPRRRLIEEGRGRGGVRGTIVRPT